MEANLNIYIQGIKGGNVKNHHNEGYCSLNIDTLNSMFDGYFIEVDAFKGQGKTYKRREQCDIRIYKCGKLIFSGTFLELCEKLNSSNSL